MTDLFSVPHPDLNWSDQAQPHSPRYSDNYYSDSGALEESDEVFIAGNCLPLRWKQHRGNNFCIGEIGFGFGLNFLNTWWHWNNAQRGDIQLHYLAFEAEIPTTSQMLQALLPWRRLAHLANILDAQWPEPARGIQRIRLHGSNALPIWLTLVLGDAPAALHELAAQPRPWVDAWYFDGFTPKHNPELWSPGLFTHTAALSRPGASFSTYTAASHVRQALNSAGYDAQKVAGFGKKRERLQGALLAGGTPAKNRPKKVCIHGKGLAGSALARSLAEREWQVYVHDAMEHTGASKNPCMALYPGINDRSERGVLAFLALVHAQRALQGVLHQCGMAIPAIGHWERLLKLRDIQWPERTAQWCSAQQLSELCGIQLPSEGLWLPQSGFCSGATLCNQRLDHPNIQLLDAPESAPDEAIHIICSPHHIGLSAQRGYTHSFKGNSHSSSQRAVISAGGYLTPPITTDNTHWIGAANDRDSDPEFANRERMKQWSEPLHRSVEQFSGSWEGTRYSTGDKLPIAGWVIPEKIAVLSALGGRGLVFSDLCAEQLASVLNDEPWALYPSLYSLLNPRRQAQVWEHLKNTDIQYRIA